MTEAPQSNSEAVRATVRENVEEILQLEEEKRTIGEAIKKCKKTIYGLGVPAKALKAAIDHSKMKESEREAFDQGYRFIRNTLEDPISTKEGDYALPIENEDEPEHSEVDGGDVEEEPDTDSETVEEAEGEDPEDDDRAPPEF